MSFQLRIKDYLDLFRFSLGILSVIAVLVAGFIVYVLKGAEPNFIAFLFNNGILPIEGLVIGVIATLLLAFGVEAINDVYDVETDRANKRFDRPIARNAFSPQYVRNLCVYLFGTSLILILALVFLYDVTIILFIFGLFCVFVGVGYNYIKDKGFIGNLWVAIGYIAPLFIGFFLLKPTSEKIVFNCFLILTIAFFLATGREIIKDIQDYEGDKKHNLNSLAVKIGPTNAGLVATIFFILTIILAIIAGLITFQNYVFWFFVAALMIILSLTSYTILKEKSLGGKKARKYTRWALWWSMAAFFLGVFFIP
jgi:geranylgeranylglycerol-phosphate geranylgeranyltransferase